MARYAGSCHCGALTLGFASEKSPAELGARTCQCSYCRKQNASWTSDPDGRADIRMAGPVTRYRFGTKTADFLLCATCGVLVAAVSEIAGRMRGVINIGCLEDSAAFLAQAAPMDLDGELLDARLDRRAQRWTPVAITE